MQPETEYLHSHIPNLPLPQLPWEVTNFGVMFSTACKLHAAKLVQGLSLYSSFLFWFFDVDVAAPGIRAIESS